MLGGMIASPKGLAVPVRDKTTPVASGRTIAALTPTLKALTGKTIGAPGGVSGSSVEMVALAKQAGLTPDFHIVEVGSGAPTLAALKTGTVDAVYSGLGSTLPAVVAGYARHVMTSREGPPAYGQSQLVGEMASQAFLDAHPDFADRHQRAITQAARFFNDKSKRQQVLKILTDSNIGFAGVDGAEYLDQTPVFPTIPKSVVSAALQFIVDAGIHPPTPKIVPADIIVAPALENG
jgi:ABC-type nitrate/sulfonate/bicarbonate transport system substrate-binding protein